MTSKEIEELKEKVNKIGCMEACIRAAEGNIESYNRFKKKWIDAQKHVNQMAKDAEVAMNISLESFKNVLIIWKFTNQFELNDNWWTWDTQSKINVEYNLFGRTRDYPKDMRAKYWIVYGSKCPINLTNYGDIRVVFKKEKLQDVTVTGDDTANSKYYASLLSDFKLTSLINNYHFTNEYKSWINSEIDVNQIDIYLDRVLHSDQLTQLSIWDNRYWYLEAQIHGPLLVNDIKEIILKSNQSIDSWIEQLIKNIGISVAYK